MKTLSESCRESSKIPAELDWLHCDNGFLKQECHGAPGNVICLGKDFKYENTGVNLSVIKDLAPSKTPADIGPLHRRISTMALTFPRQTDSN